ncbi:DUF4160 domain-containing protein [Duganella sp. FT80W]|uniref:DUF4160 domain-containing protein n=1 Tax=Duganella guangzhouensis TaxID=2666084 RepID=A0A6I2L981_9BURK|nr:DUF4160 domain-containing protein [Duganella guangzhouensis]
MPTLLKIKGYRFYFHSNELGEPPHVHVDKDGRSAKFWLESVTVARNHHLTSLELREIGRIISSHRIDFIGRWHEHFDSH